MGKVKIDIFLLFQWEYMELIFTEMFIECLIPFIWLLYKSLNLIGYQGDKMVNFRKNVKKSSAQKP